MTRDSSPGLEAETGAAGQLRSSSSALGAGSAVGSWGGGSGSGSCCGLSPSWLGSGSGVDSGVGSGSGSGSGFVLDFFLEVDRRRPVVFSSFTSVDHKHTNQSTRNQTIEPEHQRSRGTPESVWRKNLIHINFLQVAALVQHKHARANWWTSWCKLFTSRSSQPKIKLSRVVHRVRHKPPCFNH